MASKDGKATVEITVGAHPDWNQKWRKPLREGDGLAALMKHARSAKQK